ncbi:MAG: methylated-DNA--[protein]-cysteine S-methyltransferase [Blastochloris viridis]|uniref:Methylated-DNA--protein-cysteine methyltransferase n=1 Tax=Blastochloris viridis TaxID=1079 RepID=A0A6N4QZ82_BLAVI|nr:MAG: methylated-DNA--[protein]-cysteine S-methyltransferase [Blastochloris viridis]
MLYFRDMESAVGRLRLVADEAALVAVLWENDSPQRVRLGAMVEDVTHPVLQKAQQQLQAYFEGKLTVFDVPLGGVGTAFQKEVWAALLTIPYGETRSYAQLAQQIGRPAAVRAVGAANGRNPLSIIVPCHRVIGSNGLLTGFAGGMAAKAYLLNLENSRLKSSTPA